MNRPTTGKGRSTGSNAQVVCSTLLCDLSRFAKARSAPRLCQRTDFVHARHTFICGRGTSAYANLLDSFVRCVRTRGIDKAMERVRLNFFALLIYHTHLPRNIPCDSVAYAEGVQKRNPFLFLSFSYFSDRRKVPSLIVLSYKTIAIYLFDKKSAGSIPCRTFNCRILCLSH